MRNVESIEVGYGEALQFGVSQGTYYKEPEQLLTEAYEAGKREQADELEAARAEIERLENQVQARDAELWGRTQKILQLEQQLAAEQAKNVKLREALINLMKYNPRTRYIGGVEFGYEEPVGRCLLEVLDKCDEALASPSDTSALEAIVKQAGEVMREKCADASIDLYSERSTFEAIHALPAVTLEDLK